jgi:hypothetical protein
MASVPPDSRTTRWLRRRPVGPHAEPPRRPRFDRPPPSGNDWYGGAPDYSGAPPVQERPPYPWPPRRPNVPFRRLSARIRRLSARTPRPDRNVVAEAVATFPGVVPAVGCSAAS